MIERSAGIPVQSGKCCASMDAICSANHFTSAGSSQHSNKPTLRLYISTVAEKVSQLHASGEMVSEAQTRAAAAADLELDDGSGVRPRCTTELSCNRPTAKAGRAETDISGLVAACCSHVVPLLGLAIPMVTPENHTYYEHLLESLIQSRPDLEIVFLDLACRFRGRWSMLLDRLRDRVAGLDDIRLMLPMMHAFDHDMACQVKNSALYQVGAARRVGEQTEELWSEIKKFCKVARYMTHANWRDCMDMLFLLLSLRKQWNFPKMLAARILRIDAKIGTCKLEKKKIEDDARAQGVTDLDAAMSDLDGGEGASQADLSTAAQYVIVVMKLDALDNISHRRAAIDILLPDNIGINMDRRSDSGVRARLVNARGSFEVTLTLAGNMQPAQPWEVDSPEYKEAEEEVKQHTLQHFQRLIEDQVFKYSQIKQELSRLESGKNGHALKTRMSSTKGNVKGLLGKWKRWQMFPDDAAPPPVTDAELNGTLRQDFLWGSALVGNGTASARRHFGMRYRTAVNQLARTEEEVELLKIETVRVFNWLEVREGAVGAAIAAAEAEAARCAGGLEAVELSLSDAFELEEQRRLAVGKGVLLRREDERLRCIHKEAFNRLHRYLPRPPGQL